MNGVMLVFSKNEKLITIYLIDQEKQAFIWNIHTGKL